MKPIRCARRAHLELLRLGPGIGGLHHTAQSRGEPLRCRHAEARRSVAGVGSISSARFSCGYQKHAIRPSFFQASPPRLRDPRQWCAIWDKTAAFALVNERHLPSAVEPNVPVRGPRLPYSCSLSTFEHIGALSYERRLPSAVESMYPWWGHRQHSQMDC